MPGPGRTSKKQFHAATSAPRLMSVRVIALICRPVSTRTSPHWIARDAPADRRGGRSDLPNSIPAVRQDQTIEDQRVRQAFTGGRRLSLEIGDPAKGRVAPSKSMTRSTLDAAAP